MELKEGFIKNDIGIIPADWKLISIGNVCKIFGRIGFRGYTVQDIVHEHEGAITISPSNIQDDKMDFSKCTYISWFKYEESPEIKILNGDILLVKTGSTFGKTAIIKNLEVKATINPQLVVLKEIKVDNEYLAYMMSYKIVQNQINSTIVGGAIPTLSQQLVASYQIPLPPTIAEQTAIATALSDADVLISSLEQLIQKKRAIKQGAMQQLLKSREGWEVKKLGDVFTFYPTSNYSKAEMYNEGDVGCIHYGLIHAIENSNYPLSKGIKYYVTKEQAKYEKIQDGDVIMVDASEDLVGLNKSIEIADVGNKEFIAGLHTFHLRDKDSVFVKNFRGLILNSAAIKNQMLRLAVGMKVFGVSKPQLQQIFIPVPPAESQIEIATILSDMDTEIHTLEQNLSKYHLLRQGMMQELLTGKTRLI